MSSQSSDSSRNITASSIRSSVRSLPINGRDRPFFCGGGAQSCAGGTTGGLAAVEESGKSVRVLAVDETKAVVDGMKNGLVAAAVTQQPYEQGRMAIDLIAQYLYSRKLPRHKHNFTKNLVVLPSMLH